MGDTSVPTRLKKPAPARFVSRGALFFAVICVSMALAAVWWATRDNDTRIELREKAQAGLSRAGEELRSVGEKTLDAVTPERKPLLPEVRRPADNTVVSSLPSRDGQGNSLHLQNTGSSVQTQNLPSAEDIALMETLKPGNITAEAKLPDELKKEDRIVRPAFVEEMARWMASCYRPSRDGKGGWISFSVQMANARYSLRTNGLNLPESDSVTGRSAFLRYISRPETLPMLYGKYGDGFMQAFDEALRSPAKGEAPSDDSVRYAYRLYADYFASVAAALDSIAATPDLQGTLRRMDDAAQNTVEINERLSEAVMKLDEARDAGNAEAEQKAREHVSLIGREYSAALSRRDDVRRQTVNTLKKSGGRSLDDATVLFLAEWIQRRMQKEKRAVETAHSAAEVLRALAVRMQKLQ